MNSKSNHPHPQANFDDKANQVVMALFRLDFYIYRHDPIDHGYRIRLGCGVNITLYRSGTTLVQGKLKVESGLRELVEMLVDALPQPCKWHLGNPDDNELAMQLQQAQLRTKHQERCFPNDISDIVRAATNGMFSNN